MKVLLDTQAFLWFVLADPRLGKQAEETIAKLDNMVLLSPASHWEIAIKISVDKYKLPEPFEIFIMVSLVYPFRQGALQPSFTIPD
ncbi:MAG: type II toxin-antitoxin system VapC family toxin [Gammaproteobacteria bacterium]|nr:type II toxin-antitoxin system VapC family toxin [Gammaproteobacteria bacterium]